MRLTLLVCLASSLAFAEPVNPVTPTAAELAALSSQATPEAWKAAVEKYEGKILKLTGKAYYLPSDGKTRGSKTLYSIEVPGKSKPARIFFAWSEDSSVTKTKEKVQAAGKAGLPITIYGTAHNYPELKIANKFPGFGLLDTSTDPKTSGLKK